MTVRTSGADSILVLGAGELGMAILKAFSRLRGASREPRLTVLVRPTNSNARASGGKSRNRELESLGVEILRADLVSERMDQLATFFAPFDTVVCCTGFVGGPGTQRKITQAVLDAQVRRYVPWQFGVDYDTVGRGSGQDLWDEQLDVRVILRAQSRTEWTIVSTGIFTSFLFLPAFGIVDLPKRTVHALGSWDYQITVTTPEDIGELTAAILAFNPQIDGIVRIAGDTLSYRDLADITEQVTGLKLARVLWTEAELFSAAAQHPEDEMRKYRLAFARPTGVSWPKAQSFNGQHGIEVTDVSLWLRANAHNVAGIEGS